MMAIDPKDVDELQGALNDTAGKASVLWTTFITFALYLVIAFGSVTHRNLFLEDPVKLPLFNVDLPLVGFFLVAPAILVIFHFYVFLQLLALAKKARDYDAVLREAVPVAIDRQLLRQRLDSFLVLQFLAGPAEQRTGFGGLSLRLIAWITLVGGPVLILLQGQVTFLPYHGVGVMWLQRIAILIDLAVIWYFWNSIRSEDTAIFRRVPSIAWQSVGAIASIVIIIFSVCLATFPGEFTNDRLPGGGFWHFLREPLFAGVVDEVSGRPESLFSNRLVLTDQRLIDPDKLDKVDVTHSLRGRDLTAAVLNRADLRKVDFTGAVMNHVRLLGAKLKQARFGCAVRGRERLIGNLEIQESGDIQESDIQQSEVRCTSLLEAVLESAELQGAFFVGAKLQGAKFDYAWLQGASLALARLQGASLYRAALQGAQLYGAQMQGARLDAAELQGASLEEANMRGVSLNKAELQGASLRSAQLQGASLRDAIVWRARVASAGDLMDIAGADPNTMPWRAGKTPMPFMQLMTAADETQTTFAAWRDALLEHIPAGAERDEVKVRLSVLDPQEAKEPENVFKVEVWIKALSPSPQDEKREEKLAAFFADLACSKDAAPYVARSLIQHGRLRSIGSQIGVVAARLRNGNFNPSACPGVEGLTEEDWAKLDELVKAQGGGKPN
jgi:uncharacterized protein YjbI with pentapeptide repeats